MSQLVRDALSYLSIRAYAHGLIDSFYCKSRIHFARTVQQWLRRVVVVIDEPEELLIHPVKMIECIQSHGHVKGDCDDVAMLGATLLAVIGIPVRFKACHPDPQEGYFRHVFLEYNADGQWRSMDPTIRGAPIYDGECMIQDV